MLPDVYFINVSIAKINNVNWNIPEVSKFHTQSFEYFRKIVVNIERYTMNYPLFWTFFILFLCLSKVSCSVWDDLSIDGTEADTGYPSCVIDYIYIRYYRVMFPGDPLRTKPNLPYNATYEEIHFYLLLVYIHLYPRFVNFGRIMRIRYQSVGCMCGKKPHT